MDRSKVTVTQMVLVNLGGSQYHIDTNMSERFVGVVSVDREGRQTGCQGEWCARHTCVDS